MQKWFDYSGWWHFVHLFLSLLNLFLFKRICQKELLHFVQNPIFAFHISFWYQVLVHPHLWSFETVFETPNSKSLMFFQKSIHQIQEEIETKWWHFRWFWNIASYKKGTKGLSYLIACNISGLDMVLCDCAFGGAWCWWWWCKWTGWCKWWSLVPFQSVMSSLLWR